MGGACEKMGAGGPQKIKGKGGHLSNFTNVFSQSVLFRVHESGNKQDVRLVVNLLLAALVK